MSSLESILSNTARNGMGASVLSTLVTQMQGKLVQKLDADGDGSVNQGEFQAALDKLSNKLGMPVTEDAQSLFAGADSNGDGLLDGSELGKMVSGLLQMPATEGTMASFGARSASVASTEGALFDRLDADGNGQLSRAEFMEGVNQARARMDSGEGMVVHRFASFSSFSMGGMPGWMPMGWAPVTQGFQVPPGSTPPVTVGQRPPVSAGGTTTAAGVPATTQAPQPADALNALLAGADSDQDGQISANEMAALVAQLGSQLEAAARLTGRMGPVGDEPGNAQA